jgi:hypothetical protein
VAHFAEIDENNIVIRVIVIDNAEISDGEGGDDEAAGIAVCRHHCGEDTNWVQTSYNNNVRLRFAGGGMLYDTVHDTFRAPNAPAPSWTLSETTGDWEPPTPQPDHAYYWDEDTTAWLQPESPFPSWVWIENERWDAPTPYPGAVDGSRPNYDWDEETTSWVVWEA